MATSVPETGHAKLDRSADSLIAPELYEDVPNLLKLAQSSPNFIIDRTLDAPAQHIIDTFKGAILAAGDPATRVHPQVACGLVKKDTDGLISTVKEVKWDTDKIYYTFETQAMAAGIPPFGCCVTAGVGGEVTVTKLDDNKCRFEEKGFAVPRRCGLGMCCCCVCLCWGCTVEKILNMQLSAAEKAWKKSGQGPAQE